MPANFGPYWHYNLAYERRKATCDLLVPACHRILLPHVLLPIITVQLLTAKSRYLILRMPVYATG